MSEASPLRITRSAQASKWGVDEYIHHVGEITQDVVGAASHNHAWFACCEFVDEIALCLVDAVGGLTMVPLQNQPDG